MRKLIQAVSLIILTTAFNVHAEAPNLLTYQGRLKEGGQAVSGNRAVEILLCDDGTAGSCHTSGIQPVAVSNGLFRSTFTIPATATLGAGDWYLEIRVAGTPLLPRERLTSGAYAMFAATAAYASNIFAAAGSDGVYVTSNVYIVGFSSAAKYYGDGSQLTNLPASGGFVAKIGDTMTGQLTLAGATVTDSTLTVTGDAFSVGGSTLVVVNGNVGIGMIIPAAMLDVNGTVKFSRYLVQAADAGITLIAADFGKTITVINASAQTVTLPSVGAGDIGAQVTVVKLGTGKVTIQAAASTFIADSTSGGAIYNSAVTPSYATITLRLVTSTQWMLVGGEGSWITN